MKSLYVTAFGVFAGVVIGNFVWQIFTSQAWSVAVERSWFQFFAIALFTVLLAIRQNNSPTIE